jgi:hypothetical protein
MTGFGDPRQALFLFDTQQGALASYRILGALATGSRLLRCKPFSFKMSKKCPKKSSQVSCTRARESVYAYIAVLIDMDISHYVLAHHPRHTAHYRSCWVYLLSMCLVSGDKFTHRCYALRLYRLRDE